MLDSEAEKQIQELFDLIALGEDVCLATNETKSFKVECGELAKRVNQLLEMLSTLFCFITLAPTALYLRPLSCIVAKLKGYFTVAQAIVDNCKHRNLFCRLFTSRNETEFPQLFLDLDASIGDMEWLLSVYVPQSRARGSTANKMSSTVLAWSHIAIVEMGPELEDCVLAAESLASLAQQKDEYKNIICEEGGVPPLKKLLKESISLAAQIAAANALCLLANEKERQRIIFKEMISTILNRLSRTSPIWDQMQAANLVASISQS